MPGAARWVAEILPPRSCMKLVWFARGCSAIAVRAGFSFANESMNDSANRALKSAENRSGIVFQSAVMAGFERRSNYFTLRGCHPPVAGQRRSCSMVSVEQSPRCRTGRATCITGITRRPFKFEISGLLANRIRCRMNKGQPATSHRHHVKAAR